MRVGAGTDRQDDLIVVAPASWRGRSAKLLGGRLAIDLAGVVYQSNVYEAAAAALSARRQGRAATLYVMVDYLSMADMDIFSVFAKTPGVRTVAFSVCERHKKLAHARLLGAEGLSGERGGPVPRGRERATEAVAGEESHMEEPVSPAGAEVINAMASSAIASAKEGARESARDVERAPESRPERQRPADGGWERPQAPGRGSSEPKGGLLSQEELDALLG